MRQAERAECLDCHSTFADVEDDALSSRGLAARGQVNNKQLSRE
jgi:hypothetical protein